MEKLFILAGLRGLPRQIVTRQCRRPPLCPQKLPQREIRGPNLC
jgi:hypothetical protein